MGSSAALYRRFTHFQHRNFPLGKFITTLSRRQNHFRAKCLVMGTYDPGHFGGFWADIFLAEIFGRPFWSPDFGHFWVADFGHFWVADIGHFWVADMGEFWSPIWAIFL